MISTLNLPQPDVALMNRFITVAVPKEKNQTNSNPTAPHPTPPLVHYRYINSWLWMKTTDTDFMSAVQTLSALCFELVCLLITF